MYLQGAPSASINVRGDVRVLGDRCTVSDSVESTREALNGGSVLFLLPGLERCCLVVWVVGKVELGV